MLNLCLTVHFQETLLHTYWCSTYKIHGLIQFGGGGGAGVWIPSEKSQKYRVFSNIGPGPLKNHKATKPAINVGPSLTRQRNAIKMAFRWWAYDGPFIVVIGSSIPSSIKQKKLSKLTPSDKTF